MKKKFGKRIVITMVVVAAVILAASRLLAGGGESTPVVETEAVRTGELSQVIALRGIVEGSERAEVASSENREIQQIFVKEGDRVTRGQTLAVLKASEEETADEHAQDQAKNTLDLAKFDYEATKRLYEEGAVSKQELIQKETTYYNSLSAYEALMDPESKNEKNEITSPIDGTVTRVNAKIGLMAGDIPENAPLFVVENLDDLEMKVHVSEYDLGSVSVGQSVTVSAQVLGNETVQGVVSRIAPTGETKAGSEKEMVIPVTIQITEENEHLIAGVSAKAEILTAKIDEGLIVSLDTVKTDEMTGEQYVLTVEEGYVVKKTVELGLEGEFQAQVLGGSLHEGDRVILNPPQGLTEGMAVMDPAGEVEP